jgi:UDP-N-acetyl-D-glucosamine dehydrogenase
MYLSWRVKQFGGAAKFIDLARDVNAAMPAYVVQRVQDLLNDREKSLKGSRLLVIGVAYKPNISDMRESPALPLIDALLHKGAVVEYHDPFVPVLRTAGGDLSSTPLAADVLRACDCVLVLTNHAAVDYEAIAEHAGLVFDTRRALQPGPNVRFL